MIKYSFFVFLILAINSFGQTNQDTLVARNKQSIEKLKNRIATIENIGNGDNAYVTEIATLKAVVKKQNDSIIMLNKMLNQMLVAEHNSMEGKSNIELNNHLQNSQLVSQNLSDCNCYRLFYNVSQTKVDYSEFKTLDSLANVINNNSSKKLNLVGHADKTGTEENNALLSKLRVQHLKNYFITQKKVNPASIKIIWYGSANPSKDAMDSDKQFLNRRVEISVE